MKPNDTARMTGGKKQYPFLTLIATSINLHIVVDFPIPAVFPYRWNPHAFIPPVIGFSFDYLVLFHKLKPAKVRVLTNPGERGLSNPTIISLLMKPMYSLPTLSVFTLKSRQFLLSLKCYTYQFHLLCNYHTYGSNRRFWAGIRVKVPRPIEAPLWWV